MTTGTFWLTPTRSDGRPDRVLDAGCGEGNILTEFRRFGVEVDYYGVDLAVGDRDWSYRVSALADLHALPFKSSSFDKIICNQVLEHVDRPDEVLGQLVRVLRPGGSLFVSVPFVWHLHQEPHDRFRFSLHALNYLAARHGLAVVLIRPQGGYFSVIRYVLASHTLVMAQLPQPLRKLGELSNRLYKFIDFIAVAPICYFMDKLDHTRKLTLGYFLHLVRPGISEKSLPEDPYCCPLCSVVEPDLIRQSEEWICSQCGTCFQLTGGVPYLAPHES